MPRTCHQDRRQGGGARRREGGLHVGRWKGVFVRIVRSFVLSGGQVLAGVKVGRAEMGE